MRARSKTPVVSPYITMAEAAVYLRYEGARAGEVARQFLRKHGVRLYRRGAGCLLVRAADLDAFLAQGVTR